MSLFVCSTQQLMGTPASGAALGTPADAQQRNRIEVQDIGLGDS